MNLKTETMPRDNCCYHIDFAANTGVNLTNI